jgi:hypothetical protein
VIAFDKLFRHIQHLNYSILTHTLPSGAGGVGSIPANPDAQNVPSFRRWRFEMKLSPFFFYSRVCIEQNSWSVDSTDRDIKRTIGWAEISVKLDLKTTTRTTGKQNASCLSREGSQLESALLLNFEQLFNFLFLCERF